MPVLRSHADMLTAIEAIAGGRFDDALRLVQALREGPRPVQQGVCRYCACSEARGCAVITTLHLDFLKQEDAAVVRCEWADTECTVCTNVSCLERWRREAPAEMDVALHDASAAAAPASRIVQP